MLVAYKVGNLPSKFGHARLFGSRIIRYVRDGRTDKRTDKSNAYCPFPYGGVSIITDRRAVLKVSRYHFQRLTAPVDDAAIRHPGNSERYKERDDAFCSVVNIQSFPVNVRHLAILLRTASSLDVSPEELGTVDDDAERPAAGDA